MSKKRYRSKKKMQKEKEAKRLMIGLVSGGVLLIAVALIFAFGGFGEDNSGTPVLAIEQDFIDYGEVKINTDINFEIRVTNTGDGTLRFAEAPYIEVRDGC